MLNAFSAYNFRWTNMKNQSWQKYPRSKIPQFKGRHYVTEKCIPAFVYVILPLLSLS